MNTPPTVPRKSAALFFVALVAAVGGFLFGYDTAVINGANQFLTDWFHLTPLQEGHAGASAILGCIPGAMVAGWATDRFGRRRVLFVCAFLFGLSGIVSAIPQNFEEFLAARFIGGIAIGASSLICPLYIAELAPASQRGRLGSLFQLGIVVGIFLTLFINAGIQSMGDAAWNTRMGWRFMLGAEFSPALLLGALLFFVPESPRWLIAQGREAQARIILEGMIGVEAAGEEIAAVREVMKEESGRFSELLGRRFRPPLVIAAMLMIIAQFSGINAIMYYSTKIFLAAGVGVGDSFLASALVGFINLLATFIAIAFVDKAGRRTLLLIGLSIQVLALGSVGLMFREGMSGMPLVLAILLYVAAFAMALGPIPWIVSAEIFPTKLRGLAMSVAVFTVWVACYLVALTFPMMNDSPQVGPSMTFFIYGGCTLAGWFFIFFNLPETKGRTLEEIEASWK